MTPDIVGKERLQRLSEWIASANPVALMRQTDGYVPSLKMIVAAMALSALVLASGRYLGRWKKWASTLPLVPKYILYALNAVWGGFFIFAFLPSVYTIGMGAVVLVAEFLHLTLVSWEISGVMLGVGAFLFAFSRGLAIWHALDKGCEATPDHLSPSVGDDALPVPASPVKNP